MSDTFIEGEDALTATIRAHFDGKVIVPDEPIDLPAGQSLKVRLEFDASRDLRAEPIRRKALERFLQRALRGVNLPAEALRRENLYEDRM